MRRSSWWTRRMRSSTCCTRDARHHFLRKGWRGFAARHDLADGGFLVFQLTERTKFKVYIIRASSGYGNDRTSDDEDKH
uniref:TF-B3 domain-containing protein n=1 Tax=Aegilops tauschii subsp. strangulata TaxID=200361 RepID=A0A453MCX5_AEGTS